MKSFMAIMTMTRDRIIAGMRSMEPREGFCSFPMLFLICAAFVLAVSTAFTVDAQSKDRFDPPSAWNDFGTFFDDKANLPNPASALFDSLHSFDALHYMLVLEFPMQSDYFGGSMTLQFQVVDDSISSIRLHSVGLGIDSVMLFTDPAAFTLDDTSIVIDLNGYHRMPESLAVRVYYHDEQAGRGYYHFDRNSYTMSEPQDARYWFPCYDEPWDKATSEIYAIVPETYDVGSNGYLANVEHDPGAHTKTYHWVNEHPISTYLMNLIMGDFAVWNDYHVTPLGDSIPIFNMVWSEDSASAAYDLAIVPAMIGVFSELFYPYPFEKYGHGVVAPFAYGGMEHQTMTTLNRSWITGDRTYEFGYAHELAHMWWGDFVTLSDWRHIWLNEGFANYASALYNEAIYGHEAFILNMLDYQNVYFLYEQSGGRFPLFDPPELFALPVYVKGAWVLQMLRGVMGDSAFFDGLHSYASTYAYANASTEEFAEVMETASGMNLDWFFDEWVFDQGYPEYNYAWTSQPQGQEFAVHLEIAQVQTNAPIFRMPLSIRIHSGVSYNFVIQNEQQFQSYDFIVATTPTGLSLDPDNWVLKRTMEVQDITEPGVPLPTGVELESVYPNPFNGSANISFKINGGSQPVKLSIYDIQGRLIRDLLENEFAPGKYVANWDSSDDFGLIVSSGIYLVRLKSGPHSSSMKITYIR